MAAKVLLQSIVTVRPYKQASHWAHLFSPFQPVVARVLLGIQNRTYDEAFWIEKNNTKFYLEPTVTTRGRHTRTTKLNSQFNV